MSAAQRVFDAPIWASGFRPFFLLGTLYGVLMMIAWAAAVAGIGTLGADGIASASWHAREMIFGFATAIIAGVILTALPSWAGTEEIHGAQLALAVGLWAVGRAASLGAAWLPAQAPLLADAVFLPVLFVMLARQLLGVANRRYLLVLPVLAALFAAQLAAHLARAPADPAQLVRALHGAIYTIVVLYILVGGLLTPVFTGNALRATRRGEQARFVPALEVAAVATAVLLAVLDLASASPGWVAAAALACAIVHAVRIARWKAWRVVGDPIVLAMNLGYAWLVATFALRAAAAWSPAVPATAWIHAFTVGSLGMMMLGLMTRVALRHTGRRLRVVPSLRTAGAAMFGAALLRLAAAVDGLGSLAIATAALAWALAFGIWLLYFAPMLVAPSLPREPR